MSKSDRILALDIGASHLKLAEFTAGRSGALTLTRYAIESLGLDPQADAERSRYIITTLRQMVTEHGIKPGPVLLSVSGQSVFSRFVKLPPVEPDKVNQIVQYEAQQNVPFPIEEVVWDYQLVSGLEGEVDVMLAAIKGEIIEELTDCVSFAGLKPDLIDVAPMALYNAVRYNYDELPGCALIVDIGARSTDLIFLEEGRIFSRSIPVAGNAITQQIMREFDLTFSDAEDLKKEHAFVGFGGAYEGADSEVADKVSKSVRSVMTRMHAEINRSISFYRSQQSGSAPNLILITGGTSVIPYTDTFLKEKLKVDVDFLNPFQNVAVSESVPAEDIGRDAHLLGELVGLALRRVLTCPIEIDLMPPRIQADKAFEKKQPMLLGAAFLLVVAVLLWAGYFFRMDHMVSQRLEGVTGKVSGLQSLKSRLDQPQRAIADIDAQYETLQEQVAYRARWVELLNMVHTVLPGGMWLTEVSVEGLDGKARVGDRAGGAGAMEEDAMMAAMMMSQPGAAAGTLPGGPDAKTDEYNEILISGLGYIDKVATAESIRQFADQLAAMSDFFTEETRIISQPTPNPGDVVREFQILIVLKEPLQL